MQHAERKGVFHPAAQNRDLTRMVWNRADTALSLWGCVPCQSDRFSPIQSEPGTRTASILYGTRSRNGQPEIVVPCTL